MSDRALVVCAALPVPAVSGGRKRALRLVECMQRAGALPHLVVAEATAEGLADARRRGWQVEVVPRLRATRPERARQWLRLDPAPPHRALEDRVRELAPGSAWVQLEEIDVAQLVRATGATRAVVSLYNADAALHWRLARGRPSARAAATAFRALRMAATERRAGRRADALLCVSREDRAALRRRRGREPLIVPNGVDDELFDLPADGGRDGRVLFFGAHWWPPNRDGLARFVREGWPAVIAARPDARLRIVGPGPLDVMRAAARSAPGVEVVGLVEDLRRELREARAVVVPIWEGGGTRIKVLEALASARPVVGTPVGVERIGFEHERHGLVADDPGGLARGLVTLLDAPARARALGKAGRELVEPLRWSSTTAPAEALYRRWLR